MVIVMKWTKDSFVYVRGMLWIATPEPLRMMTQWAIPALSEVNWYECRGTLHKGLGFKCRC